MVKKIEEKKKFLSCKDEEKKFETVSKVRERISYFNMFIDS